jgi:hypothetical protein
MERHCPVVHARKDCTIWPHGTSQSASGCQPFRHRCLPRFHSAGQPLIRSRQRARMGHSSSSVMIKSQDQRIMSVTEYSSRILARPSSRRANGPILTACINSLLVRPLNGRHGQAPALGVPTICPQTPVRRWSGHLSRVPEHHDTTRVSRSMAPGITPKALGEAACRIDVSWPKSGVSIRL